MSAPSADIDLKAFLISAPGVGAVLLQLVESEVAWTLVNRLDMPAEEALQVAHAAMINALQTIFGSWESLIYTTGTASLS